MKRLVQVIFRIVLVIGFFLLAALIIFYAKNTLYLESSNERNIAYLKKNKYPLVEKESKSQNIDEFFTQEFYTSEVFLLGENHGFANAQKLDLILLKHLNKKVGLKYYIAEMDSLRAKNLNTYLEGDESEDELLKQVVLDIGLRIPQQSSIELFEKWKQIYIYNKTLPDSLKIKVIGIDKDFDDTTSSISRDSMMVLNFRNAVSKKNLQNEKFYGLLGYGHVLQEAYGESNYRCFAARLKSNKRYKVQSIVCYNLDGEVYFPKNPQYPSPEDEKLSSLNDDGPITLVKGINDLKEVTDENTMTLFSLVGEDSPYHTNQNLAGLKVNFFGPDVLPSNKDIPTTDFFQFIILNRNSKALTKIGG